MSSIGLGLLLAVAIVFAGCRDSDEKKVAELERKALLNPTTSPSADDGLLPKPTESANSLPHGGRRVELPNFDGCIEWEHKANETVARFYVLDSKQIVVENVTEPRLWLVGTDGPIEVEVHPAGTASAHAQSAATAAPTPAPATTPATEPATKSSTTSMKIGPGCWEVHSPQLAQETPRGIVRLQMDGQSYRFTLPTTRTIEQIENPLLLIK